MSVKIKTENDKNDIIEINQDAIISAYVAEGLSAKDIAKKYFLKLNVVNSIIKDNKLDELRTIMIREGLTKIQNIQVKQAQELMELEANFKKLKLIQLEAKLKDYYAYLALHNDFYKRHPMTNEIMKNSSGIPMQVEIPDVAAEIRALKESVNMSEGLKKLVEKIDGMLHDSGQGMGKIAKPASADDLFED